MATDENALVQNIRERLEEVRDAIARAALAAGRRTEELTLIGVSKQFPAQTALAAYQSGIQDLGENRVQDLLAKKRVLAEQGVQPNWHLIGTLQRNKVRQVVGHVHLIHSVDSLALLEEISRRSLAAGLTTDVLLQVNSTGEASKHGFTPADVMQAAETGSSLPQVRLRGLMTMAQLTDHADETLPVFARTRSLFDQIETRLGRPNDWTILSMGMSQDFLQAVACGATHLRIGSALFGTRPGR